MVDNFEICSEPEPWKPKRPKAPKISPSRTQEKKRSAHKDGRALAAIHHMAAAGLGQASIFGALAHILKYLSRISCSRGRESWALRGLVSLVWLVCLVWFGWFGHSVGLLASICWFG